MRRTRKSNRPARRVLASALTVALLAGPVGVVSAQTPKAPAEAPPPRVPAPIYSKDPTTPVEFFDAADYLVRTGQASEAVPYLKKFLEGNPDDETLLYVREKYGAGALLRLQDDPATRPFAETLVNKVAEASRKHSTRPDRLAKFVGLLTKSHEEQDYAIARLREAGPYAVPAILPELQKASDSETRALILRNIGRLDLSAVPPLVATLDAPDGRLASDAADALSRLGDARAVPALTALAATGKPPAKDAAARAIERLTGHPFSAQPKGPVRLLTDEARRYHTHAIRFPGDSVVIWAWDGAGNGPVPKTVTKSEAEATLGLKLARAALAVDPDDRPAQVVFLSLALEKAIERTGFDKFPAGDPSNTLATALSAGPSVLGDVLRTAIADGKTDLAAVAAAALGKVTDTNALAVNGNVNPLVEGLSAPGRRARFAAAKALVALDPRKPFAGSSRVVPVLAQFVTAQGPPRAVVIDGNTARGSQLVGHLKALGYEPTLAVTGDEGFKAASDSADVELILIDHHLIRGDWRLHDVLANLKADARTAGIPVYVVGPLAREADFAALLTERFPGVKFLVTPPNPQLLDRMLAHGGSKPRPMSAEEKASLAKESAALLAEIAGRPNSPFEADLARIEPALNVALNSADTSVSASAALGDVPDPNAQRGLADLLLDPGKPLPLRSAAASKLARSVQRFGPLVSAEQEAQLVKSFDREPDPALRTAMGTIIGALRPKAASASARMNRLDADPKADRPAPVSPSGEKPEGEAKPAEPIPDPKS